MTKYLGGHGTTMGGIVVESGKFPWDNGNFPQMTEPSRGYHGVRFFETFGDFGFTMKARMETMRTLGPTLAPLSAFLLLQGIETLHLRMPRHCGVGARDRAASRGASGRRMGQLPASVRQPLRGARPPLPAATARAESLPSACAAAPRRACASSRPWNSCRTSRTSAMRRRSSSIPASTTHRQLSEDEQLAAGVTPEMIRLSVGLETPDDILWDLDQALEKSQR